MRLLMLSMLLSINCFAQDGAMEGIDAFFLEDGFFDVLADAEADAVNVIYLDLSLQSPKLTAIPKLVFSMVNLKYLELGFNQVGVIDPKISELKSLEVLGLDGNKYLKTLAKEVFSLPNLKELHLKDTGLSSAQLDEIAAKLPASCKLFR